MAPTPTDELNHAALLTEVRELVRSMAGERLPAHEFVVPLAKGTEGPGFKVDGERQAAMLDRNGDGSWGVSVSREYDSKVTSNKKFKTYEGALGAFKLAAEDLRIWENPLGAKMFKATEQPRGPYQISKEARLPAFASVSLSMGRPITATVVQYFNESPAGDTLLLGRMDTSPVVILERLNVPDGGDWAELADYQARSFLGKETTKDFEYRATTEGILSPELLAEINRKNWSIDSYRSDAAGSRLELSTGNELVHLGLNSKVSATFSEASGNWITEGRTGSHPVAFKDVGAMNLLDAIAVVDAQIVIYAQLTAVPLGHPGVVIAPLIDPANTRRGTVAAVELTIPESLLGDGHSLHGRWDLNTVIDQKAVMAVYESGAPTPGTEQTFKGRDALEAMVGFANNTLKMVELERAKAKLPRTFEVISDSAYKGTCTGAAAWAYAVAKQGGVEVERQTLHGATSAGVAKLAQLVCVGAGNGGVSLAQAAISVAKKQELANKGRG